MEIGIYIQHTSILPYFHIYILPYFCTYICTYILPIILCMDAIVAYYFFVVIINAIS